MSAGIQRVGVLGATGRVEWGLGHPSTQVGRSLTAIQHADLVHRVEGALLGQELHLAAHLLEDHVRLLELPTLPKGA